MTILKRVLDILIVLYLILIPIILITGGVKFELMGVAITATRVYTPFMYLIPLGIVRLLISVELKNLVLVMVSVLFSLVVAELAIRIWDPPIAKPRWTHLHKASPVLGWELVAGLSGIGKLGEFYQINSAGFRGREHPISRESGVKRIVAIGDSFTFGMGVDLEDTYEQQLERMLTATGMRVEVLNFGVIGHSAWQHYEMLKRRALAYQPDLVVLALFADDFAMSTPPYERSPDYRGQNPFEKKGVRGVMDRFALRNFLKHAHALFEYKYRYRQERYMRNIPKRKKQLTSDNPDNPLYRIIAGKLGKRKYLEFSDMIKRFVSTADAAGANVLIVMIPDSVQLDEPHLQFSSRYAAKVAQETEVPFVDVTPILEAQADHKSLYLFPFDAHNSPRGLRIIAKAIADKIFEFGLLDSTQEQAPQRRQESAVGDLSGGRV